MSIPRFSANLASSDELTIRRYSNAQHIIAVPHPVRLQARTSETAVTITAFMLD